MACSADLVLHAASGPVRSVSLTRANPAEMPRVTVGHVELASVDRDPAHESRGGAVARQAGHNVYVDMSSARLSCLNVT